MSQSVKDFVRGMGQAFDMGGTLAPRRVPSSRATQEKAIYSYWCNVGDHIQRAMNAVDTKESSPDNH